MFYIVYTPEYRCFCIFDDPGSLVLDSSSAQVQHQTRKNMFHLIGPILYDLYNIFILLQATVSTVISHFWIIFGLF